MREEFSRGAQLPAHVPTTAAGFNYVPPSDSHGLRRVVKERVGFVAPDAELNTHQRRLVRGTLDHLRKGGSTRGAPAPEVRVHPDGSQWVVDGHHRIAVAREQGKRVRVKYTHLAPG